MTSIKRAALSAPSQRLGKIATASAVLLTLASLAACGKKDHVLPPPRPVVAVAAQADGQRPLATLPGQITSRYTTPLSFRVAGKLVERNVRIGDTVKAGQILAKLDPSDIAKSSAISRAQLDAARHQLTFAQQQLERDRAQAKENLIAPVQLEQTENAYANALAQHHQAEQQAALSSDQLSYTTLKAERAGVITTELADTGQNLNAGQPVYQFAWSGDIDVIADIAESALTGFTVGQRATVTLPAIPGKTFNARVRELSPAADTQSRTYRMKLTLEAPTSAVKLGMTANVAFAPTAQQSAQGAAIATFTLPSTALFHDGQWPAVWVVKAPADTLELRRVQVTRFDPRSVTVAGGINVGERIVWQGVHTVTAGEKVRIVAPLHPEDFAS